MNVIVENSRYNFLWLEVFTFTLDFEKKLIGQFRTLREFKLSYPESRIIKNTSFDQE